MFQKYGVHYDNRFLSGNPFVTYDTFNDPYSGLSFPPRTSLKPEGSRRHCQLEGQRCGQRQTDHGVAQLNGHFATIRTARRWGCP